MLETCSTMLEHVKTLAANHGIGNLPTFTSCYESYPLLPDFALHRRGSSLMFTPEFHSLNSELGGLFSSGVTKAAPAMCHEWVGT